MQIGHDAAEDKQRFFVTKRGVVLVTQDMLRALASLTAQAAAVRAASGASQASITPRPMPSMSGSPSTSPRQHLHLGAAVPHGRYNEGEALPNSTTCGQPTAAAACAGPESTVTSPRRARAAPPGAESADRRRRCANRSTPASAAISRFSAILRARAQQHDRDARGRWRAHVPQHRRPALLRPVLVVDGEAAQAAAHGALVADLDQDQRRAASPRAPRASARGPPSARRSPRSCIPPGPGLPAARIFRAGTGSPPA